MPGGVNLHKSRIIKQFALYLPENDVVLYALT